MATRSIRLSYGSNKITFERNGTSTGDEFPFCAKCRSRNFLSDVVESVADDERLFKGSFNWMIFLTAEESGKLFQVLLETIPGVGSDPKTTEDDDDDTGSYTADGSSEEDDPEDE